MKYELTASLGFDRFDLLFNEIKIIEFVTCLFFLFLCRSAGVSEKKKWWMNNAKTCQISLFLFSSPLDCFVLGVLEPTTMFCCFHICMLRIEMTDKTWKIYLSLFELLGFAINLVLLQFFYIIVWNLARNTEVNAPYINSIFYHFINSNLSLNIVCLCNLFRS